MSLWLGQESPAEHQEGAQGPQPQWEHGYCPPGILAPSAPQILWSKKEETGLVQGLCSFLK